LIPILKSTDFISNLSVVTPSRFSRCLTTPLIEDAGLSDLLAVILKKDLWKEKKVEAKSFQG